LLIVGGGLVLWGTLGTVTTEQFTHLDPPHFQTTPPQGLPAFRGSVLGVERKFPVLAFPDV
jgi:hypothetical protein